MFWSEEASIGFREDLDLDWSRLIYLQEREELIPKKFICSKNFVDIASWKYSLGSKTKIYLYQNKSGSMVFGAVLLSDEDCGAKKLAWSVDFIRIRGEEANAKIMTTKGFLRYRKDLHLLSKRYVFLTVPNYNMERIYFKMGWKECSRVYVLDGKLPKRSQDRDIEVVEIGIAEYIDSLLSFAPRRFYKSRGIWEKRINGEPVRDFYRAVKVFYGDKHIGNLLIRRDCYSHDSAYLIDWYFVEEMTDWALSYLLEAIGIFYPEVDKISVVVSAPYADLFVANGLVVSKACRVMSFPERISGVEFITAIDLDLEEFLV